MVDIGSGKGVIANFSQMTSLFREQNRSDIIPICLGFYDDCGHSSAYGESGFNEFFQPLKRLHPESTLANIKMALEKTCVVRGEPTRYSNEDCYLEFKLDVLYLWDSIVHHIRPDLPELLDVYVFDSYQYNGPDVPHGEACFIFRPEDCWTKILSEKGKALKDAFGSCELTTWTTYSI